MRRRALGAVAVAAMAAASLLTGGVADAQPGHQILATGLDNPRQLNWGEDGTTLIIAEAGSGGPTCIGGGPEGPTCVGFTGSVGTIARPWTKVRVAPKIVAKGLFSAAGPDGSFATGPDGADATDVPGEYISAITGIPPEARPPTLPAEVSAQIGQLMVSERDPSTGEMSNFPYLDFFKYESRRNPDHAQIDSNPYGVLFVASDAGDGSGYALVADAAANTVWKVDPDLSICDEDDCVPPAKVTVFHKWVPPSAPTTVDEDDIEYVPTSLATDAMGNIYVGGLGSLQPGKAKVTMFSKDGVKLQVWRGFTSVTGVAVDWYGRLYVSELFGGAQGNPFDPATPVSGQVTRIGKHRVTRFVPFPAGVAVDKYFNVYVSANSLLPSGFRPGDVDRPSAPGGEIWRFRF